MSDSAQDLATVALFEALSPVEITSVSELTKTVEWQAGDEIYATGDPGGSMFAVLTGAVEIFGIVSGVEKLFMTVRDGGVFGLLSILDQGDRPGNARALETTKALVMERAGLDRLLADRPEVGAKVLEGLSRTLGQRVRMLNEQYAEEERAFEIWEVAGGYQLRTRAEFSGYLQQLQKHRPLRLSRAALETLRTIALLVIAFAVLSPCTPPGSPLPIDRGDVSGASPSP